MNPFREMVLLPLEAYTNLRRTIAEATPMQKELNVLRENYSESLSDDQKLKLQNVVISKHVNKSAHALNSEIQEKPETKKPVDLIKSAIQNFSQTNKNRAMQLFNHLDLYYATNKKWNNKGELILSNGEDLIGTNIADLINYVTATKPRTTVPNGFNYFVDLIFDSNVSTHMMSNKGIENIETYRQNHENTLPETADEWTRVTYK